ncbi:MAG: hydrogenase expression/formation protein HypE [Methylococcales bacterium]|nr:hydrogenase expression/formation protein HypE [Methylococcales bacterium]
MTKLTLNCLLPHQPQRIVMAHGGGGRMMQQLIDTVIRPAFDNTILNQKHDSAVINIDPSTIALTTDSYVVKPLFFSGGDIGKLAVCGTLNDLAMSGAKPLYITCSLIIEEGFLIADLQRILESMQQVAIQAGVKIVTGDTKVVERGKGDGLYLNTAGIGVIADNIAMGANNIQLGDQIIISSDIARHGMAIMLEREGIDFEHDLKSDCADVSGLVQILMNQGLELHCLRDLTRGGLASGLIELATDATLNFEINEEALPIDESVQSACEILGFDPLYVANEGCFVLFVPEFEMEKTLNCLHQHPLGRQAQRIGAVTAMNNNKGIVTLKTVLGGHRVLDLLSGEQLPRIC